MKERLIHNPSGSVPVLFFQAGDARHLPYTFWQARHWAGDSPLILLGDQSNRHYRGLEYVPIRDFASAVPRLRDIYVHISSNTPEFEFFCLARWLVMAEFARRQGLKEFLYLDSDVLLFEEPSKIAARIPPCKITLAWAGGLDSPSNVVTAGQSLVRNPEALSLLCEMIRGFYENPEEVRRSQREFAAVVSQKCGGISDMWFWSRFARVHRDGIWNSWQPEEEEVMDINIFQGDGFRCRDGLKEIEFREGRPHGFHEGQARWVRFTTLHFGGHSKKSMALHLGRAANLALWWARLRERLGKGLGCHQPETLVQAATKKTEKNSCGFNSPRHPEKLVGS